MSSPRQSAAILAIGTLLFASAGISGDAEAPMFTVNGFGTFGVVHSDVDNADFSISSERPTGAGYTRESSFKVDSLIAVQLNAAFTPKASAVLQAMSEQNYDGTFRPHLEWASFKYQFTPEFSVQIGRSTLPLFQLSDSRKVGLTFPWVRAPADLYHLTSAASLDGITINYRMHLGQWTHSLQLLAGRNDLKLPDSGGSAKTRKLWMASNTAELGSLTVRIVAADSEVTTPTANQLWDAFRQFGPQGVAIANRYELKQNRISYLGVGASYDPGQWFVATEWGGLFSHSIVGRRIGWYASGGYRFGRLTPYLTFSGGDANNLSDPGLDVATLPSYLVGPATGLNATLNSILSRKPVERTVSIGTRWDVRPNIAFKMQFDHTNIGAGSSGVLINVRPGFVLGGSFNLVSAAIHFVY
ncbi:MAG: porin [Steroidobacteraceae bacterium]